MCQQVCKCLRIKRFCFCFSLNAGCIVIGWYLSLEAFLLMIASISWVRREDQQYVDYIEKSAYAVFGIWLLGTSVAIVVGVGKAKANYLKSASVLMVAPIILLALDSFYIFFCKGKQWRLLINILPLVMTPYFITVLWSNATDLIEKRRGYETGRESQMECHINI